MTLELLQNQEQDEKKVEHVTCEELLARLPEVPHIGSYSQKEPMASDLSRFKPKRSTDEKKPEEEEKKENPV